MRSRNWVWNGLSCPACLSPFAFPSLSILPWEPLRLPALACNWYLIGRSSPSNESILSLCSCALSHEKISWQCSRQNTNFYLRQQVYMLELSSGANEFWVFWQWTTNFRVFWTTNEFPGVLTTNKLPDFLTTNTFLDVHLTANKLRVVIWQWYLGCNLTMSKLWCSMLSPHHLIAWN